MEECSSSSKWEKIISFTHQSSSWYLQSSLSPGHRCGAVTGAVTGAVGHVSCAAPHGTAVRGAMELGDVLGLPAAKTALSVQISP